MFSSVFLENQTHMFILSRGEKPPRQKVFVNGCPLSLQQNKLNKLTMSGLENRSILKHTLHQKNPKPRRASQRTWILGGQLPKALVDCDVLGKRPCRNWELPKIA